MLERQNSSFETPVSNLDERQRTVIETGEFWAPSREDIHKLSVALGESRWSEDPRAWIEGVRSQWLGSEQARNRKSDQFTDEQIKVALPILERMGLVRDILPPPGHYAQTVVLGSVAPILEERTLKALGGGITADRMVILAGQRLADEARDGTREELLSLAGKFIGREIDSNHLVRRVLEGDRSLYETDMALVVAARLGDVAVTRTYLDMFDRTSMSDEALKRLPLRTVKEYHLTVTHTVDGKEVEQPTVILNGLPVHRKLGDPRPTTASTIIEWLVNLAPKNGSKDDPAKVLVVSSNPHTLRMIEEMHRILRAVGCEDIELVPAGTLPLNSSPSQILRIARSEIVRLVERDPTVQLIRDSDPAKNELLRLREEFINDDRILACLSKLVDEYAAKNQGCRRP